jgi:hypothetical protein
MIVFDLEANGLVHDCTQIHCIALHNTEDDSVTVYNDEGTEQPIIRAITQLDEADVIVGHNIIGYDCRVIKKLYPFFEPQGKVYDTLILSRLYHPDMLALDQHMKWKDMPTKLYGRHSLESYGYRLDEHKGDFGKENDWSTWSQEMQDYCVQDVKVTTKLCDHFQKYLTGSN